MSEKKRPKLLLIDGHSMAFRAFFALPADKFVTTSGQPTNAVYGFVSMLVNLLKNERPTHLGVAFDAGHHTFRTDEYPEYKGGRAATPEEFKGQVPLIQEVLAAMNVTSLQRDGIEADDILATLAHEGQEAGMEVLICSGDKDAFQLATDAVTVLYPVKGVSELARMTPEAISARFQVSPQEYSDLAALVGEQADNLPGVPGVGPKTAAKWIAAYGGLEGIIASADSLPGKAGESLRTHLTQVVLNRKLNQLLTDVELPVTADQLAMVAWDLGALDRVFDALQVRQLRERVLAVAPAGTETGTSDAADTASAQVAVEQVESGALGSWLAGIDGVAGIDVSGIGTPVGADAWAIAVATADGRATVIDLTAIGPDDEAALVRWLTSEAPKAAHNVKAVSHALGARGIAVAGIVFDPELAAYLSRPDLRSYGLDALAQRYLGIELGSAEAGSSQGELDLGGSDELAAGANFEACQRAWAVAQLVGPLRDELTSRGEVALLTDLELPLARLLVAMENSGVAADVAYLHTLETEFAQTVARAAHEAYAVIDREVNLSSPKQLQEVLFDQLNMPKTKKIKTGYTTDAAALADLYARTEHPFLAHLLAHRDAIKLQQTVAGLLRSVADDGRIHTTFQQTVAATGRLSSTDPNLQNIPIRTDAGRRIRRAFVVGDGFETLLTADYSQIEMRIMAHLSGDAGLIEAFRTGEDLHNYVASHVYGVATDAVTPAMRSKIKAMSYGLAYGLSSFGLSKQLDIDVAEANDLMRDYFERFGGVRDYLRTVVDEARATGYTATILGRRRYLPDLTSDNRQRRDMAERMALNAPIQGSAADIIKLAMLGVAARLSAASLESRLLLQIHDELVLEVAPGEREAVEALVREEMGNAYPLSVPLDVSVGTGGDWQTAGH